MVFVVPRGGSTTIRKSEFKILFVLKGAIEHEIDPLGEPRPLQTGDILVTSGFRYHKYINPDKNKAAQLHVMRLFIDAKAMRKCDEKRVRRPELNFSDFVHHYFNRTIQFKSGIDSEITEHLNALRRESDERNPGYRHRARSLCTDLVVAMARKIGTGAQPILAIEKPGTSHVIATAKEYILKNLASELTLGEIAWHTGKGEEHLARLFKRETGQTVFDFVREMRINEAKTYLLDSTLSLTKVADLCGFGSLSFFSRSFKAIIGMSPSQYRQHVQTSVTPGPKR